MMNNKTIDPHLMKAEKKGVSGLNHLWDGPLDITSYPKGKGFSGGKDGMKLKLDDSCCGSPMEPITQRAKNR
jgi:hypothetical protein